MKNQYKVQVIELKEVHDLPLGWNSERLIHLLNAIDYDDVGSIAEDELKDMAAMALSDLAPNEAAETVLEICLGDRLTKGQRKNLYEELKGERLWEEYAQITDHEELFNVACMLYWAFPKKFSEPDIVRVKVKISALNSPSAKNLQNPTAAFLTRLLNDGMDEHNIIYRLFDEQIAANSFPEAQDIVWTFDQTGFDLEERSNTFTIYTSWNWVDELKGVKEYESQAHSDGELK